MRTGAPAGYHGYFHESLCYGSAEELLTVAVPFLIGGAEAGEPSVVSLDPDKTAALRAALPAGSGVTFLSGDAVYARPASVIHAYRQICDSYVARGAQQIRIIGELPPSALGSTWDWWARYEAAVNRAYGEYPLWTLCAYDTRITPDNVLTDVARTHPHTATADGRHLRSGAFIDPIDYLGVRRNVPADPLMSDAPIAELTDPLPVDARRAVRDADCGGLSEDDLDDMVVAVSEVVTNAIRHGRPPAVVRIWTGKDRMVVTVTDGGSGPSDPYAGLLPATDASAGGRGLWIAYQSCNHVVASRDAGRYTLRLTAGNATR